MKVTAPSGNTVNMRAGASTSSKVLAVVPLSTLIEVIMRENEDWYKVRYKGTEGYMMAKFLRNTEINQDDLHAVYKSLQETLKLLDKILKWGLTWKNLDAHIVGMQEKNKKNPYSSFLTRQIIIENVITALNAAENMGRYQ